jgi:superfamily II DNA helicase RecQ
MSAPGDEFDEFGDPSFLMEVDLDAISGNQKAPQPASQSSQSIIADGESPSSKRRKISLSPSKNNNDNGDQVALQKTLLQYFGYPSFRNGQLPAIQAFLSEQRDVSVFQSTGSGKSLMYQLPALHAQKVVIVVSPLISLMQDQVHKLNGLSNGNDVATFLGSGQTDFQMETRALNGDFVLVYVTPEKLLSGSFLNQLANMHTTKREIIGIAIDEGTV